MFSQQQRSYVVDDSMTVLAVGMLLVPQAPPTYFNDGGGGPKWFFWSEILAKSDFFESMKDVGIFLGCEKRSKGFFGVC